VSPAPRWTCWLAAPDEAGYDELQAVEDELKAAGIEVCEGVPADFRDPETGEMLIKCQVCGTKVRA
jgi:hypothetical protein